MMKAKKVFFTFGTRPEAIKMAPVINTFINDNTFDVKVVLTAQHREMLDQVLSIFKINGDYDFNIMANRQSLEFITIEVIKKFSEILNSERPDLVFVHGDTTSTFTCALESFYKGIPVAHIEAGLRSNDIRNPFPEEINRKLTDNLSDLHFCPTKTAKDNILKENIKSKGIFITGNTVVDALNVILSISKIDKKIKVDKNKKTILMTMHRRESIGEPIASVSKAVRDIIDENIDCELIFPVHKNPAVRDIVFPILGNSERVQLIEPLDYFSFIKIMNDSYLIISDSGGIQEEAPTLKKPVLLTRELTERPEGISSGVVKLVGTDYKNVKRELNDLIRNKDLYNEMISGKNPFGDGLASKRILMFVKEYFNFTNTNPEDLGEFN
jgi:UDP-N-acetylglucosamine 2-epimerase (non-hydrolysing)